VRAETPWPWGTIVPSRSVATMRSVREANNGYNTKIQLSFSLPAAERGSWRPLRLGARGGPRTTWSNDHSRLLPEMGGLSLAATAVYTLAGS
jgi:hypothetical protein